MADNRNIEVNSKGYEWLCDVMADQVQRAYDDPWASDTESLLDLQQEIATMREVAVSLNIDFDAVVKKETSEYERARMAVLLQHAEWTPLLEHRLEAVFDDISLSHARYETT